MTRTEAFHVMLAQGWTEADLATMSDRLLDWLASDSPYHSYRDPNALSKPAPEKPQPLDLALVEEGRTLALCDGMRPATLAALAIITRIGTRR